MKTSKSARPLLKPFLALTLAAGLAGMTSCATRAQEGALIGGAGGAALGAVVARDSRQGALIGGAAGAVTGAVVGNSMDRRDDRRRYRRY